MFKPKYAPELDELIREKDGDIDEQPHLIFESKLSFADKYRESQENFESNRYREYDSSKNKRKAVQQYPRQSQRTKSSSAFSGLMSEMRNIYDEVKKELEK
ncbi:MAG TPA: hypothetical protein GX703_00365 [Erysipelothrix sp.]|jgi:hypothetical protein|nr:hypothetical protein [Erysipelothrix sp.]